MMKQLSYRAALAEVERLNAILELMRASEERLMAALAEWDSKEQALKKSVVEHQRVITKLEAHIDEQGTYNHQLVRRLADALEIIRAVERFDDDDAYDGAYKCHWCPAMYDGVAIGPVQHLLTCPVTKARAWLEAGGWRPLV